MLAFAIWAALRYTDLGRALRAAAEDGPIAAAFGVNQQALALRLSGVCAALAGVAGVCIALSYTLAPAQIYAWIGVVFAAVMMGGLGARIGPLVAGIVIGVSESVTMAVTSPSWAPLVSFSLLILVLLVKPRRAANSMRKTVAAILLAGGALALLPSLGLPLFYESFLYLVFHWIVLATSWNILSGYSGYFSFGHGAFFGAGMYTTATLASRFDVPFLWTLPAAALVARCSGVGARRRRVSRQARARRAVRAGDARVHVRRRHDRPQHADRRRAGRLSERGVAVPKLGPLGAVVRSTCSRWRSRSSPCSRPTRSRARSSASGCSRSTTTRTSRKCWACRRSATSWPRSRSRARSPASPAASTRCSSRT